MNKAPLHFTRTGEIVLHYADEGPRDAPVLVFANSLGTDFRTWDEIVRRFSDRFRVIRYDKRGHGLSGAPPAPYRMDDHVDDLIGLLDHLAADRIILCGLSVGGLIAQGLVARQPERVRGLVLSDTAARIGTTEMWNTRIEAVQKGGIEGLAEAILERWFSAAFRAGRPAELAGWRNMLVRTPVEGYLGTSMAIRDADLTDQAASIGVPTLCLCGAEDGATPPDLVRATAELIPGAAFRIIDGAGHLPCIEYPDVQAGLMMAFFEENNLV